jgi:hypothetical protein
MKPSSIKLNQRIKQITNGQEVTLKIQNQMTVMMMTSLLLQVRNKKSGFKSVITTSHEESSNDNDDNDNKDNGDDFDEDEAHDGDDVDKDDDD